MKFYIGYNSTFCVEADSLEEALDIVETKEDFAELEFATWVDENGEEQFEDLN